MTKNNIMTALTISAGVCFANAAVACTGITLKSKDDSVIVARTMDWSREEMDNMYIVAPRGYMHQSILPDGEEGGMMYSGNYGYVGLGMEQPEFIVDGTNEAGLSAALFYFPGYGQYQDYDPQYRGRTIADLQLVTWILSQFSTIDQVKTAIQDVRVVHVDPRADTVHWRITEPSGRQVILEITDGHPHFYDSLGVITNAPGYQWHKLNLNNYVNLTPGTAGPVKMGPITVAAFGAGSGLLGLPGDFTPPSRFVRAEFFQSYSLVQDNAYDTTMQAFHLLNNFDVPLGIQFAPGKVPEEMPSATQWTIATDLQNKIIYYHTMYDRTLRKIDMNEIDFENVQFQWHPLDEKKQETIIPVQI